MADKMADNLRDRTDDTAHSVLEDRAIDQAQKGRADRGAGGRGKGGRSGGQGREVQISKALSRLLRHQAENAGITLDSEGYAPLDRVLAWGPLRSLNVTFEEVQEAVTSSDKQRFSLKPNPATNPTSSVSSTQPSDWLIRANQGHSIKIESSSHLVPITIEEGNIPSLVLHGTFFYFWPKIVDSDGLKPMGRNHVHCSTGTPEDGVVSGMRGDAELIVEIDVERSLEDGVKWWKSDNDVLLTEGDADGILSTKYFKKVTGRKVDIGVLWQDGEWVADIPSSIKAKVPFGKGPRGGGGGGGRGGSRGGRKR